MPKLHHPDATSCSFDGVSYERGADGLFVVPEAAVAALVSHGFVTSLPPPDSAPPPEPPKAKKR